MRTTVTIDPDVATEIERIRRQDGRRFKHIVNDALRRGLREIGSPLDTTLSASPTYPVDLGEPRFDLSNVSTALDYAEGADRR